MSLTLTLGQARRLRNSGFTNTEIGILRENLRQRPQELDLNKGVWQAAMARRRLLVNKWLSEGKTMLDFTLMLERFYIKQKGASPWDWLKVEYPAFARRARNLKDFQVAAAKRAKKKLANLARS